MEVDIVKLHGNIELAPLTGLAEAIVDITATGTTLRENNLVVVEEVLGSTARFFANPCALRTNSQIVELARKFKENL
jgi:ATP phosphoribosyltransferase regulatory subunit